MAAADLEEVVPQLMPVIRALDALAKRRHPEPEVAIIDENQQVQMARMDIHYGFSVNGVAALHTEILKNSELAPFYRIYPEKFTSKTNGITFRRWLMGCNPQLADFITRRIGPDWKRDAAALTRLAQWKTTAKASQSCSGSRRRANRRWSGRWRPQGRRWIRTASLMCRSNGCTNTSASR